MNRQPYQETQTGWLFLGIMVPVTVLMVLAYYFQWGSNPIGLGGFIIMIVLLVGLCLTFYRLQTTVSYRKIELLYGVGLLRIQPKIDELITLEITRIPLWYGLGIKITSKGWMYTIQGRDVVVLTYRKGSTTETIMIGSAQPEILKLALTEHFDLDPTQ